MGDVPNASTPLGTGAVFVFVLKMTMRKGENKRLSVYPVVLMFFAFFNGKLSDPVQPIGGADEACLTKTGWPEMNRGYSSHCDTS